MLKSRTYQKSAYFQFEIHGTRISLYPPISRRNNVLFYEMKNRCNINWWRKAGHSKRRSSNLGDSVTTATGIYWINHTINRKSHNENLRHTIPPAVLAPLSSLSESALLSQPSLNHILWAASVQRRTFIWCICGILRIDYAKLNHLLLHFFRHFLQSVGTVCTVALYLRVHRRSRLNVKSTETVHAPTASS